MGGKCCTVCGGVGHKDSCACHQSWLKDCKDFLSGLGLGLANFLAKFQK